MKEKLIKLYKTMHNISTKGEDTKIMADCLRYLEILIDEEKKKEVKIEDENTKI